LLQNQTNDFLIGRPDEKGFCAGKSMAEELKVFQ
jgi:hypothetical protein